MIAGWVIEAAGRESAAAGYAANFYVMAAIAAAGSVLAILLTPGREKRH